VTIQETIDKFLRLDYPVSFIKSADGYEAWHPDFGRYAIIGLGKSLNHAIKELDEARAVFIEFLAEKGLDIPVPSQDDDQAFSGRFVVRVGKDLHARLAKQAYRNGVSLNQHIVTLLSEGNISDRIDRQLNVLIPKSDAAPNLGWDSTAQNRFPIGGLTALYPNSTEFARFDKTGKTSDKKYAEAA